jgi:hypothetical protein
MGTHYIQNISNLFKSGYICWSMLRLVGHGRENYKCHQKIRKYEYMTLWYLKENNGTVNNQIVWGVTTELPLFLRICITARRVYLHVCMGACVIASDTYCLQNLGSVSYGERQSVSFAFVWRERILNRKWFIWNVITYCCMRRRLLTNQINLCMWPTFDATFELHGNVLYFL